MCIQTIFEDLVIDAFYDLQIGTGRYLSETEKEFIHWAQDETAMSVYEIAREVIKGRKGLTVHPALSALNYVNADQTAYGVM